MTHTRAIPLWSLAVLACLHLGGAHAQMPFPSAALTAEDQAIADSFAQPQSAAVRKRTRHWHHACFTP